MLRDGYIPCLIASAYVLVQSLWAGPVTNTPASVSGGSGTVFDIEANDAMSYVVAGSNTMGIGGFGTGSGDVTSVVLHVEFTVDSGYSGTGTIRVNGTDTSIIPADGDTDRSASLDITGGSFLVDTWAEVNALAVTFSNTDVPSGKDVHFDCAYLVINCGNFPTHDVSYLLDVHDDPENLYSGAPLLDWSLYGTCLHVVTKYTWNMIKHRHLLGTKYTAYTMENTSFVYPHGTYAHAAITNTPLVPVVDYANLGKINRSAEDEERARSFDPSATQACIDDYAAAGYTNLILGGGHGAEIDADFSWLYQHYYGRYPRGAGDRVFPAAYFDFVESNLRRSPAPYMNMEHNSTYAPAYTASAYAMTSGRAQLFYRQASPLVANMVNYRSASRQYPHPYSVQFSGQPSLNITNLTAVTNSGAAPLYDLVVGSFGPNYQKSYALCRQALYYSWMQGARQFQYETSEWVENDKSRATPLGVFGKLAGDFIAEFGPAGPVDTPVAVISEFSNAWTPPEVGPPPARILRFKIVGGDYVPGDYQLHGLHNFFMPNYLQCEYIYEDTGLDAGSEDYAFCPTPFGDSADYLHSNVRKEALTRYGLLVWGGIPPSAPSVVRDKLENHITNNQGRVILFAEAARSMFPELFSQNGPSTVSSGTTISYDGTNFSESASFSLYQLEDTAGMTIHATVDGAPLIVEMMGGLVIVLSDYGMNKTQYMSPDSAQWSYNQIITEVPYTMLSHATRPPG
jgi:hypothetical protein